MTVVPEGIKCPFFTEIEEIEIELLQNCILGMSVSGTGPERST